MRLGIIRLGNSWSINYRMNQMWMLISYKPWMFLQSEKACLVSWKTDYIHRKEIWPMAFKVTIFETHRKLGTWRFLPKISVKMLSTSKEVCWPNKSPVVTRTVIMRSDNLQRDQMQVEMWPMVGMRGSKDSAISKNNHRPWKIKISCCSNVFKRKTAWNEPGKETRTWSTEIRCVHDLCGRKVPGTCCRWKEENIAGLSAIRGILRGSWG